jgi:pre-mRNA-splicing factor SYF2
MEARLAKFQSLREEREAASQANLDATKEEDALLRVNPHLRARLERKRAEAEGYLARQNARTLGLDLDRLQGRQYTAEEVAAWNRMQDERRARRDPGFTDYNQMAFRKYERKIAELEKAGPTPAGNEAEAMASLSAELRADEEDRAQYSKRRKFDEHEDVTYINLRNYRFNKKLSRAYDKYTEELKDNIERGTAL